MKRLSFLLLFLFLFFAANAQKYITRDGYIGFYSHTSVEDIKADNNQVASVLDVSTGEMVFQVLIKAFHFDRALMEEHFNENYLESDKFPKSTFKGTIKNIRDVDFSKEGTHNVKVEGDLTIHNVTKKVAYDGTLEVKKGGIDASSKFNINPEDYQINIPGVVRDKINKNLEVTVQMKYSPMTPKK
jgi:polyisoprenoid-binding protein YceI